VRENWGGKRKEQKLGSQSLFTLKKKFCRGGGGERQKTEKQKEDSTYLVMKNPIHSCGKGAGTWD